jgi:hypothetical protein
MAAGPHRQTTQSQHLAGRLPDRAPPVHPSRKDNRGSAAVLWVDGRHGQTGGVQATGPWTTGTGSRLMMVHRRTAALWGPRFTGRRCRDPVHCTPSTGPCDNLARQEAGLGTGGTCWGTRLEITLY